MPGEDNHAKARALFETARKIAQTKDYDRAIDMYIEGLRYAPDAVEGGYIELRELAVRRQQENAPKPSTEEINAHQNGSTPLERMLNASYLLAKDPEHLPYADLMLKAAVEGNYKKAAKWIADLMFLANNSAKKPSPQIYIMLKDAYTATGHIERAFAACQRSVKLMPKNRALAENLRELGNQLRASRTRQQQNGNLIEDEDQEQRFIASDYNLSAPDGAGNSNNAGELAKAKAFFEKAGKAAETDNFDYAIDMYLEGLRYAPDAVEEAHLPLGELALGRLRKGGKKPSMMERMKRMRGKTDLEQLLNAEYLFAKDPEHLPYAEAMLKAAVAGGYTRTADWIANLIFQTNNAAAKPSIQTYILLKDSYAAMGKFDKAVAACQRAMRLKPQDADLAEDYKNLSAELTMATGKYDMEGDFRKSIKNREEQAKLYAQDRVIKTKDYRFSAIEDARKALARNPDLPKNIFNLAGALSDMGTDEAEEEAVKLLEDAWKSKADFTYKQRVGLLRIKQLKRKLRQARSAAEVKTNDAQVKQKVEELSSKLRETELEHYRLCMENYPTDLKAKYEYGIRLIRNKRYDEAIPLFQEAQKDPQRKIAAMDKIGYCFFMKGWYADAIDVFKQAMDSYEIKEDGIAKELRYNLACAYEENGNPEKALEIYRKIAQLDFAYRDVSQRVDKLRGEQG